MSYTKTTWVTGDTITATKMNNIESGVEAANNSGSIVMLTDTNGTLNKTVNEIYQLLSSGTILVLFEDEGYPSSGKDVKLYIVNEIQNDGYGDWFIPAGQGYYAASVDDYPAISGNT